MSRAGSPSTNRRYGGALVSRLWGALPSTVIDVPAMELRCPGPVRPMSDGEIVDPRSARQGPFHGKGYRKIWARLRFDGIRTSSAGSCV